MLNPDLITSALVTTLQSIPDLVSAMQSSGNIIGHFSLFGQTLSVHQAIAEMISPSILVVYEETIPGNFDGMTQWKHHMSINIRAANQMTATYSASYAKLVSMIVSAPVNGNPLVGTKTLNIQKVEILPTQLQIMETPSIMRMQDLNGADVFVIHCIFPETYDCPYVP